MASVMFVDVMSVRQIGGVFSMWCVCLLVFVIMGASGPTSLKVESTYAYCPDTGNHCIRPHLGESRNMGYGDTMTVHALGLSQTNVYWYLTVAPYEFSGRSDSPRESILTVETTLYGSNSASRAEWKLLADKVEKKIDLECPANSLSDTGDNLKCKPFALVEEDFIHYKNYRADIRFVPEKNNATWMGDCEFNVAMQSTAFSDFVISFTIIFFCGSVAILVAFVWRMRYEGRVSQWLWEQRAAAVLLIGAICLTNPISILSMFVIQGWFMLFLGELIEMAYIFVVLLFWLLSVDKIRKDELREEFSHFYLPKVILVGVFCLVNLILQIYLRAVIADHPIRGMEDHMTGLIVLSVINSILFFVIILWLLYLFSKTFIVVKSEKGLLRRMLYIGGPTAIFILAYFIQLLSGTSGTNQTSLSFIIMYWIMVSYTWFLVIGYWPTHSADEFLGRQTTLTSTRGGAQAVTFATPAVYPETL